MYGLQSKLISTKNKLYHMVSINQPTSIKYLPNRKAKIDFAENYLAELREFEQQLDIPKIECKYNTKVLAESLFYKYLTNHEHSIVFDGSYIHAALCEKDFVVYLRTTTL